MSCYLMCLVVVLGSVLAATGAENKLQETRTTLEKWVETRQLIDKTKTDWQTDREMLVQTVQLFEREMASIDEQRSKLSTNSVQVDKDRVEAEASLGQAKESLEQVRQFATQFERDLMRFVPQLPAPLQEILKPLLSRLPSDPATTRMPAGERLQIIVGALNEIDKFNSAVTIFNEKRKNKKGEEIAVDTIYVGLGSAYFVNTAADLAGMGSPGAAGWEWTLNPELTTSVQEVVRIYRNERPARFIALPVAIR